MKILALPVQTLRVRGGFALSWVVAFERTPRFDLTAAAYISAPDQAAYIAVSPDQAAGIYNLPSQAQAAAAHILALSDFAVAV